MFKKVAFTMYPVEDMNRARDFYENILGIELSKISAGGEWIEYDLPGGGCFAITTLAEGVKPSGNSGGSVAFEVEDLEQLVEQLKSKDVEFKVDIFHLPSVEWLLCLILKVMRLHYINLIINLHSRIEPSILQN